ncbi:unnamed protein product [Amoebophrya sp. A25]|nr:unnamed protein product [Amoebophrya sp. A25]|eukprot:GSA25T00006914001.1
MVAAAKNSWPRSAISIGTIVLLPLCYVWLPWEDVLVNLFLREDDDQVEVRTGTPLETETSPPFDLILVLGTSMERQEGGVEGEDIAVPTPELAQRALAGMSLLLGGKSRRILFSGGRDWPDLDSEAEVMYKVMQSFLDDKADYTVSPDFRKIGRVYEVTTGGAKGKEDQPLSTSRDMMLDNLQEDSPGHSQQAAFRVFLETDSVSTQTNAEYTRDFILEALQADFILDLEERKRSGKGRGRKRTSVLLVTSDYHQFRSRRVFEKVMQQRKGKAPLEEVSIHVASMDDAFRGLAELQYLKKNNDSTRLTTDPIALITKDCLDQLQAAYSTYTGWLLNKAFGLGRVRRKYMVLREFLAVYSYWSKGRV